MQNETITLQVDADTALAFQAASPKDKEKVSLLFSLLLKNYYQSKQRSFLQLIDEISENAQRRGLTPEILDEILAEK